ncbi:RnfABCDGE type electron transport complex subunit G [Pseudomonas sp. Fl5BN2]|uniref:RnfABCDGE type electron transport complex subunit G n=1 Tax=Pseudomonas sp. Fl5BN2 TaxID=2697652 RepID=UPI00137770A8|nr:RnfABCDGE type electron transport complex subunit G [Pseudomonas sp. Fl5BN2]NBF05184.1 RnfABCDGE type electron transport complex subunit G [Pseudomonas sp. Fl5BN2]
MKRTRSLLLLLVLAALGVGATLWLQHATAPHIDAEQRALQARKLLDVLPSGSYDNHPLDHPLHLNDVQLSNSRLLDGYLATLDGQPSALLLRSQVTGYAGPIELLIAIDSHGRLLGSKTLKQDETPGLGGRIAEHPNAWLQGFSGKSRNDPGDNAWALKKDNGQFDQIAGATITSRAVVSALHDALRYFDEHREQLLSGAPHE